MATKEEVEFVIQEIKANQQLARKVNLRAGKTIFPVYTETELTRLIMEKLGGAKNIEETQQAWTLRLPKLDNGLIDKIFKENPDSILIPKVGQVKVLYQEKRLPVIDLSKEWTKLGDGSIRLPSGRLVMVKVKLEEGVVFGPQGDLKKLKKECVDYLALKAFNKWAPPKIAIPELPQIEDYFFEIRVEKFGKHPLGGKRFLAYGAISFDRNKFKWKWYLEKADAELALEAIYSEVRKLEGSQT